MDSLLSGLIGAIIGSVITSIIGGGITIWSVNKTLKHNQRLTLLEWKKEAVLDFHRLCELAIFDPHLEKPLTWESDKKVIYGRLSNLRLFFEKSDMDDLEKLIDACFQADKSLLGEYVPSTETKQTYENTVALKLKSLLEGIS
mgnify:FL=1